ncbi:MAG: hypothetical protein A2821_04105 [Candidatus Magasanikbacteria bacterium RIFCSPHIGHO2_01_FULL_41_23]|uniref:DUF4234 domain-containing protein n=1 Tax=Candidatus Magasanikbacteria bacterium RIFCSPLOWO2_01_FULL_40_15 TaxID=1798686 RepID=A0A1F6N390_9BACT|nr:MAG: hypothetical protein A2821_04105 [Candidatus Magasanikbacteria bacterium RIFCSPHIGHO2_01_FULL_41_23]OGH76350.1 MAG: hypothetical protein A3F22_04440 [Candidatus Magasanikbacteria bacterium RIFCSPHIGHO2_12_FULL_41_16]OGH78342.1 MAG: hypothetical protein A2983_01105 [Candidatus Magasanikbacteria bacterium RIFCSPLOWO2_01_FULL_40_15]
MKIFLILFSFLLSLVILPTTVFAEDPAPTTPPPAEAVVPPPPTLLEQINAQNESFAGESGAGLSAADPRLIVGQLIKVLLAITGTVFTCWTFYGGYLIFSSAGDSEKVEHAKSIILNGVIGIIIVLSSYAITLFIYKMWVKTQEDPKADDFNVYITPDNDYYNKDPLL